jgi:hypothetical protein
MSVSPLTIEDVREAITGHTAAFRAVTELQPAAGAGGKIFRLLMKAVRMLSKNATCQANWNQ